MEKIADNKYPLVRQEGNDKKIILPGYPTYPDSEDIYNQDKEEKEIDPEETSKLKKNISNDEIDMPGAELDVPGSELDDNEEKIGSEDEENNYYSLGGDDHNDLEEDSMS
jgi:hypothetical protein